MRFNRLLLFTGILIADELPSESSGVIMSQNESVAFVSIENSRNQSWSISDENGFFLIPQDTEKGDTLLFTRIGYKIKRIVSMHHPFLIELERSPIHLQEIPVERESPSQYILPNSGSSRHKIVNGLSGSILRSYGGNAGIAFAAVDGGRTMDVKVLFNGIDLTSPQNGLADLSQLPSQYLGFSKLQENQYLKNGSGTTDGIIQINPWSNPTGVQFQSGMDGSQSSSGHISMEWPTFSINLMAGKNTDPGTHPVIYESKTIVRKNQDFDQLFSGVLFKIKNNNWVGNLSSWLSVQERGISGLVWSPNPDAFRKDTLALFSGSLIRLFPKGFLKSSVTYRMSGENYVDPFLAIDSDHFADTFSSNVSGYYSANSRLTFRLSTGFAQGKVSSADAGTHQRNRYFIAPSITYSKFVGFSLLTAIRLDTYSDFGNALTYSGELNREILPWLTVSGSLGTSFRAPAFNDLYWNPGGNPNLNSERSTFTHFLGKFNFSNVTFELKYKETQSTDLIVWESSGNFWQPENVNKSFRRITAINGQIILSKTLIFRSAISHIQSENLSTGIPLRYSPNWIGNGTIQLKKWDWESNLSIHFMGTQIVMYGYPDNVTLDPTIISHFSLETPAIFHNQTQLNLSVSNFLNREIMTIYGYPEPSRNIRLNISYELKQKR